MSAIDLSHFLHKRAKALNLSAAVIANKAGISRQTWYRLINADVQQARISTLMRVANTLQVSLLELSCLYTKKNLTVQNNDAYVFIQDVNYPLNAMVGKDETFEKTWEIINAGRTDWVGRQLICIDSTIDVSIKQANNELYSVTKQHLLLKPQQNRIDIPFTTSGSHVQLSVHFHAPQTVGTRVSLWKMVDAQGHYCFPHHNDLSCQVRAVKRSTDVIQVTTKVA